MMAPGLNGVVISKCQLKINDIAMLFKLNCSFRLQLSVLIILMNLMIGIGSFFYLRYQQQNFIYANLLSQGEAISSLVSEDIARLVTLDDPDVASSITSKIKRISDIQKVTFYNLQDQPILQISNHERGNGIDLNIKGSILINTKITYVGMYLGTAEFVFFSQKLNNKQKRAEQLFITIMVALFLLSLLVIFFIDKKFIARLSELSSALKYSADNKDFSRQLKDSGNDQIGLAIKNYNLLLRNVEEKTNHLSFQANHDNLTNLINRYQLLSHLESLLNNRPAHGYHAVCYMDLDKFKVVNDTCGHRAGDELLRRLSLRLLTSISLYKQCRIGRIGGDEFLILIEDMAEQDIVTIVNNILQLVNNYEFTYIERDFVVGASIGCVLFKDEQTTADELLSSADSACYKIKQEHSGSFKIYRLSDSKLKSFRQNMGWVSRLYRAMDQDSFLLYLQPIVSTKQQSINYDHFETLIRLVDEGEIISPGIFIPLAEKYGLSRKIDLWVIENLCRTLAEQPKFVKLLNVISINLSALTIVDPSSIESINSILERYQAPYSKLCFEITETAVVSKLENAQKFIHFFHEKGVRFSLDDFGTGMSSFSYLTRLNVDYIKIDGSFIREMENNSVYQELVSTMIKIGEITNKEVIAEQVESVTEANLLKDMGVDYIQGYYYGKPHPMKHYFFPPQSTDN